VGAPVFLHLTLDQLCIEVSGDFLHKTPLDTYRTRNVRDGMLVPEHKVVFLLHFLVHRILFCGHLKDKTTIA
jgi:hypothetical protein